MKITLENESTLLLGLKNGDNAAFTVLYGHYSQPLYYATLAMVKDNLLAEELVQQVFVKIWQKRETIEINQQFAGYLFRVAQHLVSDFFRQLRRDQELYRRFSEIATSEYTHIEEALLKKDNTALLEKVLDILPQQRRKVFELARIEGRSYKEVAALLGISTATVRDHLVKSSKQILQHLQDNPEFLLFLLLLVK